MIGFAAYLGVLLVAELLRRIAPAIRLSPALAALAIGLLVGRTGFEWIQAGWWAQVLPPLFVHIGVLLGLLGYRLGTGFLRLPLGTVVRRTLPPALLAAFAFLVAAALLPRAIPDAFPDRSFYRFFLPLAFALSALALLAVRDLRGRPPENVGSVFLVAIGLVGAVYSFTPSLLWTPRLDPGVVWRGPVLVLGESGALGVALGVLFVLLVRKVKLPRTLVTIVLFTAMAAISFRLVLWLPFAALGFGIVLGRMGQPETSLPEWAFSEIPFLLLVALTFAPDLWRESVAGPALGHAIYLAVLVLAVRARAKGGRELVTGPGILFLALTLTVRLDRRMGPLHGHVVDFALPAWLVARGVMAWVERGRASSRSGRSTSS